MYEINQNETKRNEMKGDEVVMFINRENVELQKMHCRNTYNGNNYHSYKVYVTMT